jgi:probable F420-dependent oxidoreductase
VAERAKNGVGERMKVGVTVFLTDRTIGPAELAQAAEERGFASVYFPEHTHIPVSRLTPAPTGDDELDAGYSRTLDPWIALATAAAVTSRIRLGTGVALLAQHDPIALAKAIATLDHLSGGRVTLGLGFGWNREEMADHGVAYEQRRDVVREYALTMQSLWSQDVAEFAGEHVTLSPSWAWPKPVQQPRVPTLIGGAAGPKLFAHIAEYADGWMPFGGAGVAKALPALRDAFVAAGRDPESLLVIAFGTLPTPDKLQYYCDLGISEVVVRIPAASHDEVLPALDHYSQFISP